MEQFEVGLLYKNWSGVQALEFYKIEICIENSTVSRGIWDKYRNFKIHQNITSRHSSEWYLGSSEISQATICPKIPQRNCAISCLYCKAKKFCTLHIAGVTFTCKYFKFGLNTTGLIKPITF